MLGEIGNAAIPEIAAQPSPRASVIIGALRTERSVEIALGLAIAEPAGHDPRLGAGERVDFRVRPGKTCLSDVAGCAGVSRRIRQGAIVEHQFPELLHGSQLDGIRWRAWSGKWPAQHIRLGVVV